MNTKKSYIVPQLNVITTQCEELLGASDPGGDLHHGDDPVDPSDFDTRAFWNHDWE